MVLMIYNGEDVDNGAPAQRCILLIACFTCTYVSIQTQQNKHASEYSCGGANPILFFGYLVHVPHDCRLAVKVKSETPTAAPAARVKAEIKETPATAPIPEPEGVAEADRAFRVAHPAAKVGAARVSAKKGKSGVKPKLKNRKAKGNKKGPHRKVSKTATKEKKPKSTGAHFSPCLICLLKPEDWFWFWLPC